MRSLIDQNGCRSALVALSTTSQHVHISTYFVVSNLRVVGRDSIRSWLGLLRHDARGVCAYRQTLMPWFLTLTSSQVHNLESNTQLRELESVFDDL